MKVFKTNHTSAPEKLEDVQKSKDDCEKVKQLVSHETEIKIKQVKSLDI